MRLSLIVEQVHIFVNLTFIFKVARSLSFRVMVSTTLSPLCLSALLLVFNVA